jgi:hypothetical protein
MGKGAAAAAAAAARSSNRRVKWAREEVGTHL